jgi:hypothetical protein
VVLILSVVEEIKLSFFLGAGGGFGISLTKVFSDIGLEGSGYGTYFIDGRVFDWLEDGSFEGGLKMVQLPFC